MSWSVDLGNFDGWDVFLSSSCLMSPLGVTVTGLFVRTFVFASFTTVLHALNASSD